MENTQTVEEMLKYLAQKNEASGATYPVMIMRNDWLPEMYDSLTEAAEKTQHKTCKVLEFSIFDNHGRRHKDGRLHITAR